MHESPVQESMEPKPRAMSKRILRWGVAVVAILLIAVLTTSGWLWLELRGSLPQLAGEYAVTGIGAPVRIERDALGVPVIRAENARDLAFATGFVHGQDRFFQMDLLRRNSAGELAELVGPAALELDRRVRVHRFRQLARRAMETADSEQREVAAAYVEGVNVGLGSLRSKPPEYLLLRSEPQPWTIEDTVLVLFSMYLDLQGSDWKVESARGLLYDIYPEPLADFLAPRGSNWDAALDGTTIDPAPVPEAAVADLRSELARQEIPLVRYSPADRDALERFIPGSNNWAVAGTHTQHGSAIVANDMHLGISVPGIWYRASFVLPSDDGQREDRITGVTLPGTPTMVVGSNGHVAWGFTNSEGDWADLVIIEPDSESEDRYLTPDGPREFERDVEIIKVKGQPDEKFEVVSTIWGPVIDTDHLGRTRALRWVAYDEEGVNFSLAEMAQVRTLDEALDTANRCGQPAQNFVVADAQGRIAWTICGPIPRRVGFDGRLPTSWADGTRYWDGWLKPGEYPRIVSPAAGRIWTANSRVVGEEMFAKLGDGGYDLGARAQQIRDDLMALDTVDEQDMLDVQLDDRAAFHERWRDLLLVVLDDDAVAANKRRAAMRQYVEAWDGRASIDAIGFRLIREFRLELLAQVLDTLTAPLARADERFRPGDLTRTEVPLWQLVEARPVHLLHPQYADWDEQLLAAVDAVLANGPRDEETLGRYTWGEFNTARIQHPLSLAVPQLGRWLDMPRQPLPGAWANIPRIQRPNSGASERLAVSPGREEEGYFHMPCGQSGHFLSPHYGDGHAAWADGRPTPFLPGPAVHTLVLLPNEI